MTNAQFIEFGTHPGTIVNVSQIVSIERMEVMVSKKKRKHFEALGAPVAVLHIISIFLVGRGSIDLEFNSEPMCAATFKMLKIALTPLTIKKPALSTRQPDSAVSPSSASAKQTLPKRPRPPQ